MTHRLEITVSEETWGALNVARGHEPRASFVKRALESALDGSSAGSSAATTTRQGRPLPSASTRAPVEKESSGSPATSMPPSDDGSRSLGRAGAAPSQPAFSCPVPGCDFTAKSPKAVCGKHNRMVR